jgi:hypothetical protein
VKFRGAGQGPKALAAELVAGEVARALGLPEPEIVFAELDPALGRNEPDEEIQALIQASTGLNLALDYLPGALAFDPLLMRPEPELAAAIVWLDAFITNVDRTARNTNMLIWHKRLWLVDHGAALYFHHTWTDYLERSRRPFPQIKDHVLLHLARPLAEVDADLSARLTPEVIHGIVDLIPDTWLDPVPGFAGPDEQRAGYANYLLNRLHAPRAFVEEALYARAQLV